MTDLQFSGSIKAGRAHKGEFVTHHQRRKEVTEFRRTHFIMGKHPTTMMSHARQSMQPYGTLKNERFGSSAQSQASNFKIGSSYTPNQQYRTTYNTVTGSGIKTGVKNGLDDIKAKRTSILLGHGNSNGFVTTNQRLFSATNKNQKFQQVNKDFAHNIKASHFDFGAKNTTE